MKRTALFASIALAAGLTAPAMAQEIGGVTVSAEDWVYVEGYCETLEEPLPEAADESPSSTEELSTSSIDLSTLTRDDCAEAGLIDVPVPGETADDEMDSGDAGEADAQ